MKTWLFICVCLFMIAACSKDEAKPAPATKVAEKVVMKTAQPENMPEGELPRTMPESCWKFAGSYCSTVTNEGCKEGEVCYSTSTKKGAPIVHCVAANNLKKLGEACERSETRGMPVCEAGSRCIKSKCEKSCCTKAECGEGLRCAPIAIAFGSLGYCTAAIAPPKCVKDSMPCKTADECCSKECHAGHCEPPTGHK